MTRLTVPIFVPAHAAARPWAEQIAAAAALGADMIELMYGSHPFWLVPACPLNHPATACRNRADCSIA